MAGTFGNEDPGKLSGGRGVAVTERGDVVVADCSGDDSSIKTYDTKHGYFKSRNLVSDRPCNVAVRPDGRIFVTNMNSQVSVYDIEENLKQQFSTYTPDNMYAWCYAKVTGLAFDNKNNLLVGDSERKYISQRRLEGTHLRSFSVTIEPMFIAVSPKDKIVISQSFHAHTVHSLDHNGTHLHTLQRPPDLLHWHWTPYGVCCTSDDEVYVANNNYYASPGSIHSYSTETGKYIGCRTEDLEHPAGLALMDDEDKLVVTESSAVNIFQLQ